MGNVSVKQSAQSKYKTRRHKRNNNNNTARNKPTINNRRRNKTRRGGAPSSLRNGITNRDGKAEEELYTASKQPPLPPSFKSKQSIKSIKSKTKNKKDNETYANYIKAKQQYNVGDGLVYSVKSFIEQNVFPVVNQVNAYLSK